MEHIRVPEALRGHILQAITKAEQRRARWYLALLLPAAAMTAFGSVLTIRYLAAAVSTSSFYQYASLLFSDTDIALLYWREFALSLIDALPFLALTSVLLSTAAFLAVMRVALAGIGRPVRFSFSN